jgi:hypothetical protein
MSAADWETFSRELPVRMSSSFWALEDSAVTPSRTLMVTDLLLTQEVSDLDDVAVLQED